LFALWFLAVFLSVFWGVFSSVFWDPGKMLVGIGGTGQHAVFRTEHIATNALALDLPTGGPFGLTDEAAAAADFGFGACIVGGKSERERKPIRLRHDETPLSTAAIELTHTDALPA
jgi:hypothetical protein